MSDEFRVIRGTRVLVEGELRPAALHIRDGRIAAVTPPHETAGADEIVDVGDAHIGPGLVDSHVHVNEPGRTEWEGYATASAAALAGGVTTLVDMPLNGLPPVLGAAAAGTRVEALTGTSRVDVALWGGLVSQDTSELAALARFGVAGIKCFMSPSGVPEFPNVGEFELDRAMPVLRQLDLPLLAHAESPAALGRAAASANADADPRAYATWLASRPAEAEAEAIETLVRLCRRHRTRVHVVHVSSREGVEVIAAARAEGLPVSAETCPHYLTFISAGVPDSATLFKCAPPIRQVADREALWAALLGGTLDLVASDHSPCPPEMKRDGGGDFLRAWGGIGGLEMLLPVLVSGHVRRGIPLARVFEWASAAPARLAGLGGRKGRIAPGWDADLVVWSPETFRVDPARLHQRHTATPYSGLEMHGVVLQTWLRGRLAYDRDRGMVDPPRGEFLPVRRRNAPAVN